MKKAIILFADGDYHNALRDYQRAKEMMLVHGLCYSPEVSGIIKSPQFQDKECPKGVIPNSWIDAEKGWRQRIEITCLTPHAVEHVKSVPLPSGAELVWQTP